MMQYMCHEGLEGLPTIFWDFRVNILPGSAMYALNYICVCGFAVGYSDKKVANNSIS